MGLEFLFLAFLVAYVGGVTLMRLLRYKQSLLVALFLVALLALLLIAVSVLFTLASPTMVTPMTTTTTTSTLTPTNLLEAYLWATPFYISVFGYAILSFICLAVINFYAMVGQAVLFTLFAPYLFFYYRNYLTLSMLFTLGSLLACTFMALVRVLLVCGGGARKNFAAGLVKNERPMGFDTFSHLLFYVTLLTLLAASGFCFDLAVFAELLGIGFITACGGVAGILMETDNYKRTLRDRIN